MLWQPRFCKTAFFLKLTLFFNFKIETFSEKNMRIKIKLRSRWTLFLFATKKKFMKTSLCSSAIFGTKIVMNLVEPFLESLYKNLLQIKPGSLKTTRSNSAGGCRFKDFCEYLPSCRYHETGLVLLRKHF